MSSKVEYELADPVAKECLQRPASDPESFQSSMFYMNQLWVRTTIAAIKSPAGKFSVFMTEVTDNTKKIIAEEENMNHIQVLDITDNASVCDDATLDALMGTTHNRAVFFPRLCKKTAVLNYVYGSSDFLKLHIREGESPREVHAIYFLKSVHIYIPGFQWISFDMVELQKCSQSLELFRSMLSERSSECCICMEPHNSGRGWKTPEAYCFRCLSSYCALCTKKLMKGRRKLMLCAFCKQPVPPTRAMLDRLHERMRVYP